MDFNAQKQDETYHKSSVLASGLTKYRMEQPALAAHTFVLYDIKTCSI